MKNNDIINNAFKSLDNVLEEDYEINVVNPTSKTITSKLVKKSVNLNEGLDADKKAELNKEVNDDDLNEDLDLTCERVKNKIDMFLNDFSDNEYIDILEKVGVDTSKAPCDWTEEQMLAVEKEIEAAYPQQDFDDEGLTESQLNEETLTDKLLKSLDAMTGAEDIKEDVSKLEPKHDSRKSFYDKAKVDTKEDGSKVLYSYGTPVCEITKDGEVKLLSGTLPQTRGYKVALWKYSQTTLRHVKEFLKQNGFKADSLKQMEADYLKDDVKTEIVKESGTCENKPLKEWLDEIEITKEDEKAEKYLVIEGKRSGYSIGQVENNTVTVGELREILSEVDDDVKVVLGNDMQRYGYYTYGPINSHTIKEVIMVSDDEVEDDIEENLNEDTVKHGSSWVNKGKEGTHGKFKTKKEADAQRKAMFARGFKEELTEADKPAAQSIEDCQKWVDYDMKHYGNISARTNRLVRKAGFQIVKDDHGDYEVTAGKFESLDKDEKKSYNVDEKEDIIMENKEIITEENETQKDKEFDDKFNAYVDKPLTSEEFHKLMQEMKDFYE